MCVPDDDEVFEDAAPPALQQDGPSHPLQGEDIEIRSDTPTVVADSSPQFEPGNMELAPELAS
eukprot:12908959-Prorocentrum_lima.AAC.1